MRGLSVTDHEPVYRRVLGELRALILSGELAAGDRFPSVREIAERYTVTSGTANRAVGELRAEGLIISRQGSGSFVRPFRAIARSSPTRLARERWGTGQAIQEADTGVRPRTVDVEVGEEPALDWVAAGLGIEPEVPVVFRRRRFVVDDRSVQLATSYLPTDVARGTPIMHTDTGPGGIYGRLADVGHAPVAFTEYLRSRMPYPEEVKRLELPEGTPVMEITRHAFQQDGRCVEVNRMVLDGTAYVVDYTFSI
jgi:GntR family transcriptional regulator